LLFWRGLPRGNGRCGELILCASHSRQGWGCWPSSRSPAASLRITRIYPGSRSTLRATRSPRRTVNASDVNENSPLVTRSSCSPALSLIG
jgi:hypothetical protein